MTSKQKEQRKHLIFSNFDLGGNCHEGCQGQGYCDCDYIRIEDERMNLDKNIGEQIIAIARLGLWNGTKTGYKILGTNIKDILYSETPYVEWYSDGRNVKSRMAHHDGTNYIEYRVVREGRNIEKLLDKLYNQEEVSRQQINYYTKSLHPYIAEIYGWG